jgi:hypothetical protein
MRAPIKDRFGANAGHDPASGEECARTGWKKSQERDSRTVRLNQKVDAGVLRTD